ADTVTRTRSRFFDVIMCRAVFDSFTLIVLDAALPSENELRATFSFRVFFLLFLLFLCAMRALNDSVPFAAASHVRRTFTRPARDMRTLLVWSRQWAAVAFAAGAPGQIVTLRRWKQDDAVGASEPPPGPGTSGRSL